MIQVIRLKAPLKKKTCEAQSPVNQILRMKPGKKSITQKDLK